MKTYQIANILLQYPAKWEVENEGNLVSFYDAKDGFGALQLSHFFVENPKAIVLEKELIDFIERLPEGVKVQSIDNYAHCSFINEDEIFWEYWLFLKENTLLVLTYNCSEEDFGKEKAIVDSIVESAIAS